MEPVDDNTVSRINSICHEIQTLYNTGTPIFTKENIYKAGQELRRFQEGERDDGANITLKGINGIDYEIFVNPLRRGPPRKNQVLGGSKWEILYCSIENLTTYKAIRFFEFQSAYLPMKIYPVIRLSSNKPECKRPPAPSTEDFSTYQAIELQWRTSKYYEQLQEMLSTIKISSTLTKVIALALGRLIDHSQIFERGVLQHALISAIHSTLIRRNILSVSSERYVQDPVYTRRDRNILHSAALAVLNDPQAFLELDEQSLLVCIYPNPPVAEIVADICRPGIILWNREGEYRRHSPRVKSMIKNEYSEIEFPYHECFGDLVMLIRKST